MAYFIKDANDQPIKHDDGFVFMAELSNVVKAVDVNKRLLHITGSDETTDRDGDIVVQNGWDLGNYLKNPVFLWSHVYSGPDSVPLGKAIKVIKRRNPARLDFVIQFSSLGLNPFADMILALYNEQIINASSVGFIPREWEPIDKDNEENSIWSRGRRFTKQELLELSGCSVPANPAALQNAVKNFMHPQTTANDLTNVVSVLIGTKQFDKNLKELAGIDDIEVQGELQEMKDCEIEEVDDGKTTVQVPLNLPSETPSQGVDNTIKTDYNIEQSENESFEEQAGLEMEFVLDPTDLLNKGICGSRSLSTDDSPTWDGSGARSRIAAWAGGPEKEDINWSKYKQGFVWVDASDTENFGSYKLPFADIVDGSIKAKWGGVRAAMAAVLGARGGTQLGDDRKAAYNFLAAYYNKFDKPVPDFHSCVDATEKYFKYTCNEDEESCDLIEMSVEDIKQLLIDPENQKGSDAVGAMLALIFGQGKTISVVKADDFVKSLMDAAVEATPESVPTKVEEAGQTSTDDKNDLESELQQLHQSLVQLRNSLGGKK